MHSLHFLLIYLLRASILQRPHSLSLSLSLLYVPVFRIRISTDPHKEMPPDPDPHGQMRIRIQEVKKHRKCTVQVHQVKTEL